MRGSATDAPWRHLDFRYLLVGRVVDTVGNAAAPVALAFAVLDLTGSTADLGLVVGARSLANVALVLFGGVLADRWKRSTVLVWSNVAGAASQACVAVLVLGGQATVPRLIVLGVLNGATAATSFPAANALVPQTVPATLLPRANALNRLGTNGASMAGAALGGLVVASIGPGWGLVADAATFLLAALAYARVRATAPGHGAAVSLLGDLRDGWSAFTSRRWTWVVVAAFSAVNAAWAGTTQVLGPAVADRTVGRAGWGSVMAAVTAGLVLGGLVALRRHPRFPLRAGVAATMAVAGLPLALGLWPLLPVLLVAALVSGACIETFGVAWDTALQQHVPQQHLARVYSYDALGSFVAIPVGQVAVGPLAAALGERTVLLGLAALVVVAAASALAFPGVRVLRRVTPDPVPAPEPARTLPGLKQEARVARTPGDPTTLREDGAPITVVRAGRVSYLTAWDWQRDLAARRAAGEIGDVLLLLEHPRVYTLGRRADETHLVFDEAERARRGIDVHRIDRGGDVTYHGPGQLVGYPIFGLGGPRVVDHVRALEELNLRVAADYGIAGERVDGFSGVWVGHRKVTAIGVHVTAGYVTTHGWATNVTTDLSDFDGIVPCGIDDPDRGVASLASLGAEATIPDVIECTERAVAEVYGAEVVHADVATLGLARPAA